MEQTIYSATFTFAKKQFDEAFFTLDAAIAAAAKQTPGYLGEESWENHSNGQVCNVYYWESLEALQQLMQHPDHLRAKNLQASWLNGYQVTIAKVLRSYGDGRIASPIAPKVLNQVTKVQ